MRSICSSWALVAVFSFSVACAPTADAGVDQLTAADRAALEEVLFQMESDWVAAYASRDFGVFDRMFADDFIYTTNDGVLYDKASFIALAQRETTVYDSTNLEDMEIRWYGNTPVITGVGADYLTQDGIVIRAAGRFTNVFAQRAGQWQVIVGHSAAVR
jgi:ketosteroid isomerase-like protein